MICNNLEDCKNENAASDVKPLMFVVILWSWAERKKNNCTVGNQELEGSRMILVRAPTQRDGSNGNVLSVLKASNAAETSSTFQPPIFCDLPSLPPFLLLFPPRPGCLSQPGRPVAPSQALETTHVSFLKAHWSSPMGQLCVQSVRSTVWSIAVVYCKALLNAVSC